MKKNTWGGEESFPSSGTVPCAAELRRPRSTQLSVAHRKAVGTTNNFLVTHIALSMRSHSHARFSLSLSLSLSFSFFLTLQLHLYLSLTGQRTKRAQYRLPRKLWILNNTSDRLESSFVLFSIPLPSSLSFLDLNANLYTF